MSHILITQCLQNDFVKPIERYDPLPNLLHVGYHEALRLMGEVPAHGPVMQLMKWAYQQDDLNIINIRDWHDPHSAEQQEHLSRFGNHCLIDGEGSQFVFGQVVQQKKNAFTVDASGLNDFYKTNLDEILTPMISPMISKTLSTSPDKNFDLRIGVIGVWTDVKVLYLCYELKTRFPQAQVAVCSALCASSSRSKHFIALEHLQKMLDVMVISSLSTFADFLGGTPFASDEWQFRKSYSVELEYLSPTSLDETDTNIVQYLFRDCQRALLKVLDGGFSGNVVMKASGINVYGHRQAPTVVKIGQRDLIAQEREAFERVQEVLGNNAPAIVDFAERDERGAIKYRYASMIEGNETTFQDFYVQNDNLEKIAFYLNQIFARQLSKLYDAKQRQKVNLLKYYDFQSKYAAGVQRRIEALPRVTITTEGIDIPHRKNLANLISFYQSKPELQFQDFENAHYFSFIHGDLNGRNIIIDAHDNVWLIDFFHTKEGHILQDLIKLENDILFIFSGIDEKTLEQAYTLSEILTGTADLGAELEDLPSSVTSPTLIKAYQTIKLLRCYYPRLIELDRDPLQLNIAQMRYAVHTLSFDESDENQKIWALYHACLSYAKIEKYMSSAKKLRVDFLQAKSEQAALVALTILPGRKDRDRNLEEDIFSLQEQGISAVVVLLPQAELEQYGVGNLIEEYRKKSLEVFHLPIVDQGVPSNEEMRKAVHFLQQKVGNNQKVLIHCTGGLGRSGVVAACFLKSVLGVKSQQAIDWVRQSRSKRAIENEVQEKFVFDYRQ